MEDSNQVDPSHRYEPVEGDEPEEMTRLREAAKVSLWVEIARSNTEHRRKKRRRPVRRRKD